MIRVWSIYQLRVATQVTIFDSLLDQSQIVWIGSTGI